MRISEQNIDYSSEFHLKQRNEEQGNYSKYIEQIKDTREDSATGVNSNASVNDLYESMKLSRGQKIIDGKIVTDVCVYNMSYRTTLYISEAGTITCIDMDKSEDFVLWELPFAEEEETKIYELVKKKMDFILRDKEMVEEYLKGNITIEDIEKWQSATKNHTLRDELFAECSEDIRKVWEGMQKTGAFSGNPVGRDYFLTEMDKYMLMNLSNSGKIKDGSLEDIMDFVNHITGSLKDSLELYSISMQKLKLEELNVWEKFSEELKKLK